VQGGVDSSEFRIPDSELDGSVELRVPSPQPSRLTPVPSDKILFPRRMLYVEAVLYLTVAAAAFGLGYLMGRGRSSAAGKEELRGVEGKVLISRNGATRGDEGAVVVVLPDGKFPDKDKRLPIAGLRPDDPPPAKHDATSAALAKFGGAATRTNASGDFTLSVPAAGSYRILVISKNLPPGRDGPEKRDLAELEKYFAAPDELLKGRRYDWRKDDLRRPLEVTITE
jgi:hypothetical protein